MSGVASAITLTGILELAKKLDLFSEAIKDINK